jgi:hypothetical protein
MFTGQLVSSCSMVCVIIFSGQCRHVDFRNRNARARAHTHTHTYTEFIVLQRRKSVWGSLLWSNGVFGAFQIGYSCLIQTIIMYEGESINKVNLSMASTQPFWQLTVSDNIANFMRKLSVLQVQTCSNVVLTSCVHNGYILVFVCLWKMLVQLIY